MTLPAIKMPEGEPSQGWWNQLVQAKATTAGKSREKLRWPFAGSFCTICWAACLLTQRRLILIEAGRLRWAIHTRQFMNWPELKGGPPCSRKAAMGKLIIDPQKLAEIRAAIDALDAPPATGQGQSVLVP
jgi:hypothetical protein